MTTQNCFYADGTCSGESKVYYFRLGSEQEIQEEDTLTASDTPIKHEVKIVWALCENHKRGELHVQKPMRPSIPYQGMARMNRKL